MDTKRLILISALMIFMVIGWQLFIGYMNKLHPGWAEYMKQEASTQPVKPAAPATGPAPTTHSAAGLSVSTAPLATQAATAAAPTPATAQASMTSAPATTESALGAASASATTQPANLTLGSTKWDPDKKGPWALGVEISPHGAGLHRVVINQFRKSVSSNTPYDFQQPCPVESEYSAALATRSITIDGNTLGLSDVDWQVDSATPSELVLSVPITDHGAPVLTLRKTFTLTQRSDKSMGYEMSVRYSVGNASGRSLGIKVAFNGTNVPAMENNRDQAMVLDATNSGDRTADVVNIDGHDHLIASFKDDKPIDLKAKDSNQPFLWAGVRSNYFDAYVRFVGNDNRLVTLDQAQSMALTPSAADKDDYKAPPPHEVPDDAIIKNVVTGFETTQEQIPAGGTLELPVTVYMGPAARDVLDSPYYEKYPRNYDKTLVIASGYCGMLTLSWLVNWLFDILWFLHLIFRDWGLAIIGLVVLVRAVLHPITKRSQVSMMKMGKMGPEMERLKKKYGDDKEGLNKAMAEFYKTQGVAPFLGCLPLFLQMPIWIALWSALQSTFEIRHASFLWGLTWIKGLAQPDQLLQFKHPVPLILFGWHLYSVNVLPLLLALTSFFQQKVMTPQSTSTMTPEQQQQQKMMKWMSVLLFPLMFYTSPSGLMLYIITSNAIAIVEGQIIRKHIKEQEEKAKAGLVIVDEPLPVVPVKRGGKSVVVAKPKPAGGLAGWMEKIQKLADDAQKQQQRPKKVKRK